MYQDDFLYAFIDEPGNLASNTDQKLFILSAVITDDEQSLHRSMLSAKKKIQKYKGNGELKAFRQNTATRRRILSILTHSILEIDYVVFNLSPIQNQPKDFEEIYRFAMGFLCSRFFKRNPKVSFVLDKRYTKPILRDKLDNEIFEMIQVVNPVTTSLSISHEDSIENAGLRAADFFAYEIYQKFKSNSDLYELFEGLIKNKSYFSNITWKNIKKESKTP